MSVPAMVWLSVGLATILILLALVVGLVRQVRLLAQSLAQFQKEVRPILDQMRADAERAQERAERLRQTELSMARRSSRWGQQARPRDQSER
jgi:Sec-independent protein translocase protein TatA